jgi:hypothetical protein
VTTWLFATKAPRHQGTKKPGFLDVLVREIGILPGSLDVIGLF